MENTVMCTISKMCAVTGALGLALFAACSEGIAPTPQHFDDARVEAGVATVTKVAASPALEGLDLVTRFGGDASASLAPSLSAQWSPGLGVAVGRIVAGATSGATYFVPVMRPSVLGKTFVYDPARQKYVSSDRSGAPANGVRFVLYAKAPNGEPNVGREIGHADLTDEARALPSVAGVKLVAVTEGVTRLSYSVDVTLPGQAPRFVVQGFLVEDGDRLDFTVTASEEVLGGGLATVDANLVAVGQDFEVNARVTGTPREDHGDGEVDLTVASSTDRIVVDATTVNGRLDATFTVNGALLARARGNPKHPEITGADGKLLPKEEMLVLAHIVEMSEDVFDFVCELVEPAGVLLLVALGLE
jgi:hypothetical protein